ncbi:MAG: hypothetical protein H6742_12060 [Alphaproteobacteria bacterium]|nr:hypothetical protein [Alphaproteobacteria bacterium]
MLPPLLLALPLALPEARAAAPLTLDPPVPVHGAPHGLFATTWDLPPQRAEYMTEPVAELRCPVSLRVAPDGALSASAPACPETMRDAALDAIAGWSFAGPVGPEGTTLTVSFVLRHSETIGSLSLFAEVDPGPDHADGVGRPGLKLVSPARPKKPLVGKRSGALRKAGAEPGDCVYEVRISASGTLLEQAPLACPEPLRADAEKRLARAKWRPGREDGVTRQDVTEVTIAYP